MERIPKDRTPDSTDKNVSEFVIEGIVELEWVQMTSYSGQNEFMLREKYPNVSVFMLEKPA